MTEYQAWAERPGCIFGDMTDIVDTQTRSRMMSGIKGKDTQPEMLVRRRLHSLGYRYRLHVPELPGRPDLVFPSRKAVVQVQGCFWHHHHCKYFKWPSTRKEFWRSKLEGNEVRDSRNLYELKRLGWRVLIIWECAIRDGSLDAVISEATSWLDSDLEYLAIPEEGEGA